MFLPIQQLFLAAAWFSFSDGQFVPAKRQVDSQFCVGVRSRVRSAGQGPSATAFCSSYIRVPAQTKTTTTSIRTITARTSTTRVTTTRTTGDAGTTTVTSTVSDGVSTVTESSCDVQNTKRQATATVPEPSVLRQYPSGRTLSSACSCLAIPTGTTTVSVVGTTTSTPKRTVTSTTTAQGTAKVTQTSTVTVPSSTTTTNIPAASCTPILKDGSFEECPDSSIDTEFAAYDDWQVAGAVKFEKESTDGFSSPFGDVHVHFYGNTYLTGQLVTDFLHVGHMDQGKTYTLTLSMKISKNDGVSTASNFQPCYLNADFALQTEIWRRDFTSADTPGDWQSVAATFQYPYDSSAQFDINLNCPYNPVEVLVDNVQITPANDSD